MTRSWTVIRTIPLTTTRFQWDGSKVPSHNRYAGIFNLPKLYKAGRRRNRRRLRGCEHRSLGSAFRGLRRIGRRTFQKPDRIPLGGVLRRGARRFHMDGLRDNAGWGRNHVRRTMIQWKIQVLRKARPGSASATLCRTSPPAFLLLRH